MSLLIFPPDEDSNLFGGLDELIGSVLHIRNVIDMGEAISYLKIII